MDEKTQKAMEDAARYITDGSLARDRLVEDRAYVRGLNSEARAKERSIREARIRDLEQRGLTLRARILRESLELSFT